MEGVTRKRMATLKGSYIVYEISSKHDSSAFTNDLEGPALEYHWRCGHTFGAHLEIFNIE